MLFAVCCALFAVCGWFVGVCCRFTCCLIYVAVVLSVVCCLLVVGCWLRLFFAVAHCSLFVVCCPLLGIRCSLFGVVVRYLLFAAVRCFFVRCYLLSVVAG